MITKYYLNARLFPTLLTCIPLLVLTNFFLLNNANSLIPLSSIFQILINIGISGALIFLMVQINRLLAKEVFQRIYFHDELKMPTVNQLMGYDLTLEESIKNTIRERIQQYYNINLLDFDAEKVDELRARKLIASCLSLGRNDLRDNRLLLQHNIEYGFMRNLIGGSLLAFIFSIGTIFYSVAIENRALQFTAVLLALIYLIILLSSKSLINYYGKTYAKIFFEQFLSLKK
ncbi:MAG: hypothetical protein JNJ41_01960 [Bacteroidia bacterium]|nr:hypothetical protein [Bacteroidia bacterium]